MLSVTGPSFGFFWNASSDNTGNDRKFSGNMSKAVGILRKNIAICANYQ